ncbi:uncharacterized protein UTRI_10126 [Ustilago trichophora]|uniref:Uncharacterized protein n=1 Tax=Ustilago trichophora TaxID=86804 RepID=A0A5C3E2K9_9BASI|nr:uncharacterized protein UTRI_10126 [Ustilago trichophora]
MVCLFSILSTTVFLATLTVADQSDPYFSSPASGASWKSGDHVFYEWRNAPRGQGDIYLYPVDWPSYGISVATNIKSRFVSRRDGYCDGGVNKEPCARYSWVVPADIESGSYFAVLNQKGDEIIHSDEFLIN